MKLRSVVSSLAFAALAVSAGACGKSSDLGRMAEETGGIVKNYAPRFDQLDRRADSLATRGTALRNTGAEAVPAIQLLGASRTKLNDLRQRTQQAPAQIAAAVKAGKLDDMNRLMNRYRTDFENGNVEVTAGLDAVESWIWQTETQPRPNVGEAATPAAVPPEAAPAGATPPAGTPQPNLPGAVHGAGSGDASPTPAPGAPAHAH